jgi:hypothetical protein
MNISNSGFINATLVVAGDNTRNGYSERNTNKGEKNDIFSIFDSEQKTPGKYHPTLRQNTYSTLT